jgi:signal peptidase I
MTFPKLPQKLVHYVKIIIKYSYFQGEFMKKRYPVISFFLSMLCPGTGQIYNNQKIKGLLFFIVPTLIILLLNTLKLNKNIVGLAFIFLILICFYIYNMIDALVVSIKKQKTETNIFNKWYVYTLMIVISTFILFPINKHEFGLYTMVVTGNAMDPTLHAEDRVIISRNNPLERGDLIVFNAPAGNMYIKRIIAFSGESVEIKNNQVYINNKPLEEPYLKQKIQNSDFSKVEIPNGKVFVLGDNRQNSYDSRLIGPVSIDKIIGKTIYTIKRK